MIKQKANVNVKNQKAVRRLLILAVIVLVGGGFACWGATYAFDALRKIWLEQFRVQDATIDVVATSSGKSVLPDTIIHFFHLTNGVNLATFPYEQRSRELVASIPQIRSISIERRLPRRVIINVKEREPAVHVASGKGSGNTGFVADYDGVIFRTYNASSQLPTIRESAETRHTPGQRLEGHALAALQLVHALADAAEGKSDAPELATLHVREIDTSKKDHLLVTLTDSSTAEIAWYHMGEDSEAAQKSLRRQLVHLAQTIATGLKASPTKWIFTEYEKGGRAYAADTAPSAKRDEKGHP